MQSNEEYLPFEDLEFHEAVLAGGFERGSNCERRTLC